LQPREALASCHFISGLFRVCFRIFRRIRKVRPSGWYFSGSKPGLFRNRPKETGKTRNKAGNHAEQSGNSVSKNVTSVQFDGAILQCFSAGDSKKIQPHGLVSWTQTQKRYFSQDYTSLLRYFCALHTAPATWQLCAGFLILCASQGRLDLDHEFLQFL
jgi:hypothetical protein